MKGYCLLLTTDTGIPVKADKEESYSAERAFEKIIFLKTKVKPSNADT